MHIVYSTNFPGMAFNNKLSRWKAESDNVAPRVEIYIVSYSSSRFYVLVLKYWVNKKIKDVKISAHISKSVKLFINCVYIIFFFRYNQLHGKSDFTLLPKNHNLKN